MPVLPLSPSAPSASPLSRRCFFLLKSYKAKRTLNVIRKRSIYNQNVPTFPDGRRRAARGGRKREQGPGPARPLERPVRSLVLSPRSPPLRPLRASPETHSANRLEEWAARGRGRCHVMM